MCDPVQCGGERNLEKCKIKFSHKLTVLSNSSSIVCIIFSSIKEGKKMVYFPCQYK